MAHGAGPWLRASEALARVVERDVNLFRTNNLGCRRTLLLEVPFDESFDAAAGEDRDWCVRAERAGARFTRQPAAIAAAIGPTSVRARSSDSRCAMAGPCTFSAAAALTCRSPALRSAAPSPPASGKGVSSALRWSPPSL